VEIHPITEPVQSLKEFGVHYLLIVLGIATALGLEQWREKRIHRKQAKEAVTGIEEELRANLKNLHRSIDKLRAEGDRFAAFEHALGADSFASADLADRATTLLKQHEGEFEFGFHISALRRSAWDAAMASGALQHAEHGHVVRYARVYAAAEELVGHARLMVNGNHVSQISRAIDMYCRRESTDTLRFARAIRELVMFFRQISGTYVGLVTAIEQTLDPSKAPAA
jgi:hypothetical protein